MMSDPIEQHTLKGFALGDTVGYTSKNAGYRAEIIEILSHDHIREESLVKLALPNGSTVVTLDKYLARIDTYDTSRH